jgi:hypothetical protein
MKKSHLMARNTSVVILWAALVWGASLADIARAQNTFPSSGNVGIGTSAPSSLLQIQGGATSDEVRLGQDATNYYHIGRNTSTGALDFVGTQTGYTGLTVNGPVGIGSGSVISSGFMVDISASSTNVTGFRVTNNGTGALAQIQNRLANAEGSFAYYGITDQAYTAAPLLANRAFFGSSATDTVFFTQGTQDLIFGTGGTAASNERMRVTAAGNVGIGTSDPMYPLAVHGTIQAMEVIVNTGWSDYVFAPSYRPAPLSEIAAYVMENHHLPGIPSEAEVLEKGVSLGEMQSKLLAKIEELTLHAIEAEKRSDRLERENGELRERVARIEARKPAGAK